MSKMQKFIQNDNNNKGIQIQYHLIPLSLVKEIMKFDIDLNKKLISLKMDTINKLEYELDRFTKQKQKFNQLKDNIDTLSMLLTKNKIEQMENKKNEIDNAEFNLKSIKISHNFDKFNFNLNSYILKLNYMKCYQK